MQRSFTISAAFCALSLSGLAKETSTSSVTTAGELGAEPAPHTVGVTQKIHQKILTKAAEAKVEKMEAYTEIVPEADDAEFEMLPIPGGTYNMGSPDSEKGRKADEGPQREIKIEPFWMGKVEVTWELFHSFISNENLKGYSRNKDGTINRDIDRQTSEKPEIQGEETLVDIVSQPTAPLYDIHLQQGSGAGYSEEYPACSMTQHAASKFCEWLSAQTGHYYRLPTEAEWEYACRAGTQTPYSYGDDASKLGEYAWFRENSRVDAFYEYEYQPVGEKKPNPWGLHDMHGNVAEWVIDSYQTSGYAKVPNGTLNPVQLSKKRYPRVVRGGHFQMTAEELRSAARFQSEPNWKIIDPQRPKSVWYHTSAPWVGFRVIRPAKIPSTKEMHLLWNTGPGEVE